ncbi:HAMP domain-containing sensor histidine kinase [Bacillus carboniphilus]|uniref:histidine kinase n=1 Tax=Bacillus carboniphilus TaxID=86663 RepID=A0ABN0WI16_9BACI
MVNYLKDFLLTIFFIFSPLVFYPYIYKYKNNLILYRFLILLLFSVIIVTIMSLPINIEGVVYDFRSIPVIVGSLYGGPIVSSILFSVIVVYRWVLGNPNTILYIVSLLPTIVIVFFCLRKFIQLNMYSRILLAVVLCTIMKMLTITIYLTILHNLDMVFNNLVETLQTYFVQALIVGICVYLVEFLNKYFYIQDEVYKSERIKLVSEMAASVAHEIRNPLTSVRGFIQLLAAENVDSTKKEYYQKICLEELERADHIISDYLSLAKSEPEIIEKINVKDEIEYLSHVLLTYATYNNIEIQTVISEDQDFLTMGDKFRLRQAFINIGKNAIEAMENGGMLEIKVSRKSQSVEIVISDTGIGMTPEQISRLGTPYYSTKEKGTGLGTMVSFSIIKKLGGKIDINSEVNKGTTYTFTFPAVVS